MGVSLRCLSVWRRRRKIIETASRNKQSVRMTQMSQKIVRLQGGLDRRLFLRCIFLLSVDANRASKRDQDDSVWEESTSAPSPTLAYVMRRQSHLKRHLIHRRRLRQHINHSDWTCPSPLSNVTACFGNHNVRQVIPRRQNVQ